MPRILLVLLAIFGAPYLSAQDADPEPAEQAGDQAVSPQEEPYYFHDEVRTVNFKNLLWPEWEETYARKRWHPLVDLAYLYQRDFSDKGGELHSFEANVNLASFSPVVFGIDVAIETGNINAQNVRRGKATGYLGLLLESNEHAEDKHFRDLFNPERRSNRQERAIGIEWGIIEMKNFFPNDHRTYGGFRSGIRAEWGWESFSAKAGAAVEIYTDRTLWDLNFALGYGRPRSPIGVTLGYRNLSVDEYHGNFVTIGFDYRF